MQAWTFRVWLSASPDDLLDWSNALFEAGCDDSTPGTFEGRAHTDFHRNAETLDDAIRSAVEDVHKAGLTIDTIEINESEIATWPV